jgi:hypothetical protein
MTRRDRAAGGLASGQNKGSSEQRARRSPSLPLRRSKGLSGSHNGSFALHPQLPQYRYRQTTEAARPSDCSSSPSPLYRSNVNTLVNPPASQLHGKERGTYFIFLIDLWAMGVENHFIGARRGADQSHIPRTGVRSSATTRERIERSGRHGPRMDAATRTMNVRQDPMGDDAVAPPSIASFADWRVGRVLVRPEEQR